MNEKQAKKEQRRTEFFTRLEGCSTGERTALKRSLGIPFGKAEAAAWAAFYKVMPSCAQWEVDSYFFIACAWCAFSKSTGPTRSFIACLRVLSVESDGIKQRLLALLDTPWDDSGFLVGKLGRLLRMIRQKGDKPDFEMLLQDLQSWDYDNRYVQLRWAREFFGTSKEENGQEETSHVD